MSARRRASGAALITAVFLIVVLLAMGIGMSNLSNVQVDTSSKAILAARVYYGARTGLEWAIQRTISDPAPPARCNAFSGGQSFSPAGTGLAGVTVVVACAQNTHGSGNFVYYLTSTACTTATCPAAAIGSSVNYAERRMEATVSNIP